MTLKREMVTQGNFLFRYRSYLPVIILLIGIILYVEKEMTTLFRDSDSKAWYELFCFAICMFGLFIRSYTLGYVAERTSGRNTTEGQVADTVNTTGMYSMVRHPLYVGNFFMWLGIAAFTMNFWFLIAFIFMYWVYYERIMYAEEEFLTGKFGDAYTRWAAKTPAFIPSFNNFIAPSQPFNFRKVIRQEKTGLLNVFLVILVLKIASAWYTGDRSLIETPWILGFSFSLMLYIIVKILQKRTTILAENMV
jgi:protein-S-isoprenylcysteine O-methyltransferase Ste14